MKTKKLIELLQREDPTGEEECCVGNCDIFFVSKEPAYYDGPQQVLILDELNPYYNVIGAKIKRNGHKIQIHCHSIDDAIWENPDLPVDVSECADIKRYTEVVETWREEARKGIEEVKKWSKDNGVPMDGKGKLTTMENIRNKVFEFFKGK